MEIQRFLRVITLLVLLCFVCSFDSQEEAASVKRVERPYRRQRRLRGSTIDATNSYKAKVEKSSNNDIRIVRRILQAIMQTMPGATPEDPIGLWHVSPEDVEKFAPPSLGGKNMNYGASSAAKAAELAARAAAGVQTGVVTAGSNNILPNLGHHGGAHGGHHGRPGGVDIFALSRRKKAAMEARQAAVGKPVLATAGILEMPGKVDDEKMKHVPAAFDEFDGKTGEFLSSSNSHFPTTAVHHGTKDQLIAQQAASEQAAMAAMGGNTPAAIAAAAAPV